MTRSCVGKRACSIVSSQPSYCMRSASGLPMMQMWSPARSANGAEPARGPCATTGRRPDRVASAVREPPKVPPIRLSLEVRVWRMFDHVTRDWHLDAATDYFTFGGIGVSQPAMSARLHALDEALEVERRRLIRPDEADVASRPGCSSRARPPTARVDGHPPEPVVQQILRRAVRRREHAPRLARASVGAHPGDGHLLSCRCRAAQSGVIPLRICPRARISLGRDRIRGVAARLHPDVLHAAQDRMAGLRRLEDQPRAHLVVGAVVRHPRFAEDLPAETARVSLPCSASRTSRTSRRAA